MTHSKRKGCWEVYSEMLYPLPQESGDIVVDSRDVAGNFGKEHKHVLESVDSLVAQNSATKTMFHQCGGGRK